MEIDRKELKRLARQRMGQARPKFWQVALVYLLMTSILSNLLDFLPLDGGLANSAGFFLSVLMSLYTVVIRFGFMLWSLWTFRQLDPGLYALTQGFSVAGRIILLELSITLRTVGWIMLLSFGLSFPVALLLPTAPILFPVLMAVLYGAIFIVQLRYALAPYLLADLPDDGVGPAIHRSVELMREWKWELFKLQFSFLGWELLGLLLTAIPVIGLLAADGLFAALQSMDTAALNRLFDLAFSSPLYALAGNLISLPAAIWLLPYRSVTMSGFYDARLRLHRANTPEATPV